MRTVVVVDDNEVERLGRRLVLESAGYSCSAVPWEAVTEDRPDKPDRPDRPILWTQVDLVLASVRPDGSEWDHYAAIGRVADLRDRVGPNCRLAVVLNTEAMTNPLLGMRLSRAGVTEILHSAQVGGRMGLDSVASGRTPGRDPQPPTQVLKRHRIGPRSDPTAVIEKIVDLGESNEAYYLAFSPGYRQNECGLSRRQAHTLRVHMSRLGDLQPDPARSMGGPERDHSLPHWSEVVAFVNLCRGWDALAEVTDLDEWRLAGRGRDASAPTLVSAGADSF